VVPVLELSVVWVAHALALDPPLISPSFVLSPFNGSTGCCLLSSFGVGSFACRHWSPLLRGTPPFHQHFSPSRRCLLLITFFDFHWQRPDAIPVSSVPASTHSATSPVLSSPLICWGEDSATCVRSLVSCTRPSIRSLAPYHAILLSRISDAQRSPLLEPALFAGPFVLASFSLDLLFWPRPFHDLFHRRRHRTLVVPPRLLVATLLPICAVSLVIHAYRGHLQVRGVLPRCWNRSESTRATPFMGCLRVL